ncbi:hypothetical protein M422DRAFT_267431 [Sphaerobolus stellatus SS14]|uniref:Uncharacterized protein n=1 Tax=Sphaerobolus stellatus (strain SS14) TaxID=990650 RepID=A0A0C9U961_SPHS4|nr:hypothetical protein M422DRAFT_267431 [Sphaerobolus stellatus SS14]
MNPIVPVTQAVLEAIPIMLDTHKIHTRVVYMNGTRTDATTLGRIFNFIKKVIQDGLVVNLVLDTHADIDKGLVCIKPARGSKKPSATSLQDWLESFLGEKVLNALGDPRCTVVIFMSTCGPLMLTERQRSECHDVMKKYNLNYIIGTDCASLVPAMTATAMARVLQLISSFKFSPKDAIEEACAQRVLGMYTRIILMTLIQKPGNNYDVDDIMFSYAAGTVRVHGLTNPVCPDCGSNTKEEQHKNRWFFKCLKSTCNRRSIAVERPEDVTRAVRRDLTEWVWVQGKRPSWDDYPHIWLSKPKEVVPPSNKGKEKAIARTTGIPTSLQKVAANPQIRELEKEIAFLRQHLTVQTNEMIRRGNLLDDIAGVGNWEDQPESSPIDSDEMEVDDNI